MTVMIIEVLILIVLITVIVVGVLVILRRYYTPGPALAPCPHYSPVMAPYTGSHNSVLHLKDSKHGNHDRSRIATPDPVGLLAP